MTNCGKATVKNKCEKFHETRVRVSSTLSYYYRVEPHFPMPMKQQSVVKSVTPLTGNKYSVKRNRNLVGGN